MFVFLFVFVFAIVSVLVFVFVPVFLFFFVLMCLCFSSCLPAGICVCLRLRLCLCISLSLSSCLCAYLCILWFSRPCAVVVLVLDYRPCIPASVRNCDGVYGLEQSWCRCRFLAWCLNLNRFYLYPCSILSSLLSSSCPTLSYLLLCGLVFNCVV